MNRSTTRTIIVALVLTILGWHASADAAKAARCHRLCKTAIYDCFHTTSQRLSRCRRTIEAACRRKGPSECRAARDRGRQCEAECGDLTADCGVTESCNPHEIEPACRASDAGLAACQATRTETEACAASCGSVVEVCERFPVTVGPATDVCTDAIHQRCRLRGADYCTADDTVNGCNLLAAEDLREQTEVLLDPVRSGCILVSPGTTVHVALPYSVSPDASEPCTSLGCILENVNVLVGGTVANPDAESPFNTVVETGQDVHFDTPGTFGYWTIDGRLGAVIVDGDASR